MAMVALSSIFPAACLLCGRAVSRLVDFCQDCEQQLPRLETCCSRCAQPMAIGDTRCGFCMAKPWRYERCICLLRYEPPVTQLVARFKYHEKLAIGRTLSVLLAQKIGSDYSAGELPDVIVPVPLHDNRLKERGFNQSLEIARVLAAYLGMALEPGLIVRTRPTLSQVGLSSNERELNVKGAFSYRGVKHFERIAVVDDVLTSGASTIALSRALPVGTRLHLWCLARAVL